MTSPLWQEDVTSYERPDGMTVIRRRTFAADHFDYKPGQHVVFGGPSRKGKTSLAFDLMGYIAKPDFPAYVAVSKPQDPVTAQRGRELGFRRVTEWPPPVRIQELLGGKKPSGFLIWIAFGDLNTDMQRAAVVTDKLLMERYANGANPKSKGGILVMDDTMVKAKIMVLDNQMVTILAMAGAMKMGLWVFVQKPTDSGRTALWGYEMADHLFFTKGGDSAMMKRYIEIIGEHGPKAKEVIPTLKPYQFLYVNKPGGFMCIVDAD